MAYTTINKSTDYFNPKLYSGTGSSQNITGVGFQPDFTWIKSRSTTHEHKLIDVVRGVTKAVASDNTTQEFTDVQGLTAFGSDGYTIGTDSYYNTNGHNYASWNWKAGNSQGSSNTAGSINTAYTSVNTTAGFSISTYTGTGSTATVGHGLGVAPAMIIIKSTSFAEDWLVYHQSMGNTHAINLNLTNASSSSVNYWQNTTPSSSVFYIGANDKHNKSGATYVAYCFAEKKGYSKFGSYVGNGNANGAFVYTGFKPAFVMIKITNDTGENWQMYDNKRTGFNVDNNMLRANLNNAEQTDDDIDLLSNGFKLRRSSGSFNSDGANYIYMAFGQSIVGSNNVPANAR
jgi:hypothetical protein